METSKTRADWPDQDGSDIHDNECSLSYHIEGGWKAIDEEDQCRRRIHALTSDVVPMWTEEKPDGQWAGTRPFRSAPRPPTVLLPSAQSVRAPTARAGGALRPGRLPRVVDFAEQSPLHLPAHNNSHRLPPSDSLAIIMYLHYSSLLLMYSRPLSITSGILGKYP